MDAPEPKVENRVPVSSETPAPDPSAGESFRRPPTSEFVPRHRLDMLVKIAGAVNSSRDLQGIFQVITAEVRRLIPYDRASIALLNEDHSQVQVYALADDGTNLQVGTSMPAAGTVTAWVTEHNEPIISNDLPGESRFVSYPSMLAQGFRSSVSFPLSVRGQKLGTLNFTSREPNCYGSENLDVIKQIADPVAIAIDNLRLFALSEKRLREAEEAAAREETINRIVSAIRRTLDIETILQTAAEQLGRHVGADRCLLYSTEETETHEPVRASCYLSHETRTGGATWLTVRRQIEPDLRQGQCVSVRDTALDAEAMCFNLIQRMFKVGAVLYVPAVSQGKLTAVIELNQGAPRCWTEGEISLVKAVADHVAVSLHQAKLLHEVVRHSAENARLVNELRETNEKMAQVNQLKDEFLANLSHELRTPLTAVTAWAELLGNLHRGRKLTTADIEEGLETILQSASALTQLIEDLLDLSRVQNNMLDLDRVSIDLHHPIDDALRLVSQQAKTKHIELKTSIASDLPPLLLDSARMRQVVWNLLTNSIKFTPSGGTVEVTATANNQTVELAVRDTGIGIDPAFLPYVFDRFRREENLKKRKFRGLGIGLTLVKAMVEAHGGRIIVQSSGRNQGTTFIISFPLPADAKVEGPMIARRTPSIPLKALDTDKEILVVEDDPEVLKLLGRMIEHLGYTPRLAENPLTALKLLSDWTPDLIVTDLNMPEMDGFEFLNLLRKNAATANLPVIALTGYVTDENKPQIEKAAFDDILSKPVRHSRLAATLHKHLS